MPTAATVNELVNALLDAQTATTPVVITLTGTSYDMSTSTIPRDSRFWNGRFSLRVAAYHQNCHASLHDRYPAADTFRHTISSLLRGTRR